MNSLFINNELSWLTRLITRQLQTYFKQSVQNMGTLDLEPSDPSEFNGWYSRFVTEHGLEADDRAYLILSLVPFLKPQLMDIFNVKNSDTGQRFVEFGCFEGKTGVILPSLDTILFILAGDDIATRMRLADRFTHHPVFSSSAYFVHDSGGQESFSSMILRPTEELLDNLVFEKPFQPHFSSDFPARLLKTSRSWDELILDQNTMEMVDEIRTWIEYGEKTRKEWGLESRMRPGYRALFYGQPGCGKSFTASLLGQATGRDVYCIDLSMMVSKYVGETEKNLAKVFQMAENKDWVLFFDEADALFGKRTGVKDSHDRYANQEVAYLLQRIESYEGLVILSTNMKSNIDEAFARRFQSVIRFPVPDAEQRERIWRGCFSSKCVFDDDVDIKGIAQKYEISGGYIVNVVQYCSVMAMSRGENIIRQADLMEGIRRELRKEGKLVD